MADVKSLTHYGDTYDGNTRYFRSTLFVAAVRSCYGESCLLHGVEWMPPKVSPMLTVSIVLLTKIFKSVHVTNAFQFSKNGPFQNEIANDSPFSAFNWSTKEH